MDEYIQFIDDRNFVVIDGYARNYTDDLSLCIIKVIASFAFFGNVFPQIKLQFMSSWLKIDAQYYILLILNKILQLKSWHADVIDCFDVEFVFTLIQSMEMYYAEMNVEYIATIINILCRLQELEMLQTRVLISCGGHKMLLQLLITKDWRHNKLMKHNVLYLISQLITCNEYIKNYFNKDVVYQSMLKEIELMSIDCAKYDTLQTNLNVLEILHVLSRLKINQTIFLNNSDVVHSIIILTTKTLNNDNCHNLLSAISHLVSSITNNGENESECFKILGLLAHNRLITKYISMALSSARIRVYFIPFITNIVSAKQGNNIDILLNGGYIEEIVECFKNEVFTVWEINKILYQIFNLLHSVHCVVVISNVDILCFIAQQIKIKEDITNKLALLCIEGLLKQYPSKCVLFQGGELINIICKKSLENNVSNSASLTSIFLLIVLCIKEEKFNSNAMTLLVKILNNNDIRLILKNLSILSDGFEDRVVRYFEFLINLVKNT